MSELLPFGKMSVVIEGDCLETLRREGDDTIDAVVTDPPYGISFLGNKWDHDVPSKEVWQEVFRVLKPGGHLIAFFGTRTYHRGAVEIEDAGFEIRDMMFWAYGNGFPKGRNIGKALQSKSEATEEGARWEGWNTTLKPSQEPIVLARKPLEGPVEENVLEWGTGAINVAGCQVDTAPRPTHPRLGVSRKGGRGSLPFGLREGYTTRPAEGRWPPNLLLGHSDECTDDGCVPGCPAFHLDEQSGHCPSSGKDHPSKSLSSGRTSTYARKKREQGPLYDDDGAASRYFPRFRYERKASRTERDAGLELQDGGKVPNNHPTVKPINLMRWLCRLVTPPLGIVLDPFCGSGTTGIAARLEGFRFVGCELDPKFAEIARKRIDFWEGTDPKAKSSAEAVKKTGWEHPVKRPKPKRAKSKPKVEVIGLPGNPKK